MHPSECGFVVYQLHRGQSDEYCLPTDLRAGHGFETLLLASAFRLVKFVAESSGRDHAESNTLVWIGVVVLHSSV